MPPAVLDIKMSIRAAFLGLSAKIIDFYAGLGFSMVVDKMWLTFKGF